MIWMPHRFPEHWTLINSDRMKEFEVPFSAKNTPSEEELKKKASVAMGAPVGKIASVEILKRSLDARSKDILYRYRVRGYLVGETPQPRFVPVFDKDVTNGKPVIIAGAGPAGLFAALELLQRGFKPIILERGKDVHARKFDMAAISRDGVLNPDSNYCFGEGGAGTFSDGKLYTRSVKRGNVSEVIETLIAFGAKEQIRIDAHPHIGSDALPRIMENIRKTILERGGEYHFENRIVDFNLENDKWVVKTLDLSGGGTAEKEYVGDAFILATGHSATDIYELLYKKGWTLERKGFALGVRAEHPQHLINNIQYHGHYQPYLPAAEYSLVEQVAGRGVFSFCMCPGGILVPSSTEQGGLVLNGMSNSMRNSKWANAGIVTSVEPEDVDNYYAAQGKALSGIEAMLSFRRDVEAKVFDVTSSFKAPGQRMTDFVRSKKGKSLLTPLPKTSYSPGAVAADLNEVLPEFVAERLKKAFPLFDRKMKGYYTSEALLLAVESRTSSPVRIPRDNETFEYVSAPKLYPCGEGAGYSGGIVSSALDGINAARAAVIRLG